MGSDFSLSDYLRRNNITKVLLIGNVDYYISPDFALENWYLAVSPLSMPFSRWSPSPTT